MYMNKRSGTSEAVYDKLKEQILHLELPPGSAISEIDTAAKYEISRTPVRDAFKMLEREGLLEIRPHIGTFVSLIDLDMIADTLYIREVLEQAVFRDLATSHNNSQEFAVRLILQQQKDLLDSDLPPDEISRAFVVSDNAFHNMLYELAGKQNVMRYWQSINSQYERFRTFLNLGERDNLQRLYQDHILIWDYISNQEYDRLSERVAHHLYDGFNASAEVVYKCPEYFIYTKGYPIHQIPTTEGSPD